MAAYYICFTGFYMYVQFRQKYIKNPSKVVNVILLIFMGYLIIAEVFSGMWDGSFFVYQSLIGFGFGLSQLVIVLNFDNEIH